MEGRRSKRPRLMSTDDDKEDKRVTTRLQEQRHREENIHAVLNNHIIYENITSSLSWADMKAASAVSRQFLQTIRKTRRFAENAVLAVTDKNHEDVKSILMKTDYTWRGVTVDVMDPTNIVEDLRRVLKSAEFVSLEGRPWVIKDRAVKDATAVSLLTAVLTSTLNLPELKLDIRVLLSNVGGVFSSPAVQETLRNLSRLDLVRMTEVDSDWGYEPRFFNSQEENAFWSNFGLLTELPNCLKSFKLTRLSSSDWRSVDSFNRSVLRLLRNNRATLEHLELPLKVWLIKELQTVACPALKSLTASVEKLCDKKTLSEFLQNLRSLEELTLKSMGWVVLKYPLYTAIKVCSVSLTKLHWTAPNFDYLDWSFLAAMTRLKDFRLKTWGEFKETENFLVSLPKNQLECLSLEVRKYRNTSDTPAGFWRLGGVENEFHYKTELLEGFRCLRKLSFLGIRDAVDNPLMQWLLKEFVSLEEFQLSDCSMLTDAGVSGRTTADWGRAASFADLRCLKALKIVRCRGVTPNGVLASCGNVPSLRSLEYTNPPGPIVESVVLELVDQNPWLERLTLCYDGDVGDLEKLKAKVMKMNARVELLAEDDG